MTIGERIKAKRHEFGWTLRELEAATGLSNAFLSQIETGKTKPGTESLVKLSEALGVSIDELVNGETLGPDPNRLASIKRRRRAIRPVRIAFDIGGVISKYPEIFREMIRALDAGGAEVHVITDMHRRDQSIQMLAMNGIDVQPLRLHNSDFETYGEACKAVLLEQLEIDVMIDDFPAYVASGCPVRMQVLPDITRPYYADEWKVPTEVGDFGRRKRTEAYVKRIGGTP